MSGGTTVRPTIEADIPALAAIAAESYADAFASILDADTLAARTPAYFAARFAESWRRMMTALHDGRIIGFLLMTDLHIDMLFVEPAAYGSGAGKALLRAAEKAGARTLECFADNAKARAFYEHNGWQLTAAYARLFAGRIMRFVQFAAPVTAR